MFLIYIKSYRFQYGASLQKLDHPYFYRQKKYGNYKVWVTSDPMDLSGRNKI